MKGQPRVLTAGPATTPPSWRVEAGEAWAVRARATITSARTTPAPHVSAHAQARQTVLASFTAPSNVIHGSLGLLPSKGVARELSPVQSPGHNPATHFILADGEPSAKRKFKFPWLRGPQVTHLISRTSEEDLPGRRLPGRQGLVPKLSGPTSASMMSPTHCAVSSCRRAGILRSRPLRFHRAQQTTRAHGATPRARVGFQAGRD